MVWKLYLLFVGFIFKLKIWLETTFSYGMDLDAWFSKPRDKDDTPDKFTQIPNFINLVTEMTYSDKFEDR